MSRIVIKIKQTIAITNSVKRIRCLPLKRSSPDISSFLLDIRLAIFPMFINAITRMQRIERIHNPKIKIPLKLAFSAVDLTESTLLKVLHVMDAPSSPRVLKGIVFCKGSFKALWVIQLIVNSVFDLRAFQEA